uniref:Uncharacterized protein n=1 Tax=Bactrocera latifrons TaxID=174628 RepID=A0A0K8UTN0_BACLA
MCSKSSSGHYESTCLSGEDVLTVAVDAKLTRNQYNIIRLTARDKFPSYKVIQEEKKKCYPSKEHIKATNTLVCSTLPSLLDHTICRLIIAQRTVIDSIPAKDLHKLRMYTKWEFDGSSGHSSYKQVFHGIEASDSAASITSIVLIRIVLGEKVVWQNPAPSFTNDLIVEVPKPGFGNSNDGNIARRFFKEAEVSAEIKKLDLTLIKRLHNILIPVASGHKINVEKFTKYCQDTAR